MRLMIHERRDEADGVISLSLARADGGPRPPWAPGAHVDVGLGDGIVRHYSLCSDRAVRTEEEKREQRSMMICVSRAERGCRRAPAGAVSEAATAVGSAPTGRPETPRRAPAMAAPPGLARLTALYDGFLSHLLRRSRHGIERRLSGAVGVG